MELYIAEKLLLVAKHPEKGRFLISGIYMSYGLAGAILFQMVLEDKLAIENGNVILKGNQRSDDPIVREVWDMISRSRKPRKIRYWVMKIGRRSGSYKWIFVSRMAEKRLIRIEEKKFLGFIPCRKCYLTDRVARTEMIQHLRSGILHRKELSSATICILGLIEACKLHKAIAANTDELKTIKSELRKIIKESPLAEAVDKTIKEVQAAILTTIIATSAATAASSR